MRNVTNYHSKGTICGLLTLVLAAAGNTSIDSENCINIQLWISIGTVTRCTLQATKQL